MHSIDLKILGNEIYSRLDQVEEQLIKNAHIAIHKMTDQASSMAKEYFMHESPSLQTMEYAKPIEESENLQVTLENGTLANIKMNYDVSESPKKK